MKKFIKNQGFTLIELMVVIAIVGLLSSVVLASLGSTKLRAKDTAVRQIIGQMRSILATQYAENPNSPSYFSAAPSWTIDYTSGGNMCATKMTTANGFTAANATALLDLCGQLVPLLAGTGQVFFFGASDYANTNNSGFGHLSPCNTFGQCYVIIVKMPSTGTFYCASGKQGTPANTSTGDTGTYLSAGCWENP